MRSSFGRFIRSPDCVICWMPSRWPRVHTFVAMNACSRMAGVMRSPSTPSAVEYIGEVSMSFAPAAKNASSTSFNGARADAELPTSNGPDVPRPSTGISSPLEGIRRVMSGADAPLAAPALPEDVAVAAIVNPPRIASRLFTVNLLSDERGVGLRHACSTALHDARQPQRYRQHLFGIEACGMQLRFVEVLVGP